MRERGRWIGLGVVAVVVIAVGAWLLWADEPLAAIGIGGGVGDLGGPDVLGGTTGFEGDAGVGGTAAVGQGDGGWGAAPPVGRWLPHATVTNDPSSPHGALAGRVISRDDGAAIANAELVFLHDGATSATHSRDDGTFVLQVAETGNYVLAIASAEGYLPFAPEWGHSAIAFEARAEQRIDGVVVQLVPTAERVVEVVDRAATPVPGATVTLAGASSGERAMAPVQSTYTTDGEGRATVAAWRGAMVEATHPERGRGRRRIGFRRAAEEEVVQITLGEGAEGVTSDASLSGVVVDGRGAPIEGAVVSAYRQARGLHPSGQGTSDPDGRFTVEGLDEGPHMLVAHHPAYQRARIGGVQTGSDAARVVMQDGGAITGRVVDSEGQPVPAATVLARVRAGRLMRRSVSSVTTYDADGRFEMTGVPEGDFELVATARGFPPSEPVPVSVRGDGASSATITMQRGGSLSGVVRSAEDGAPIQGATLALEGRLGAQQGSAIALTARAVSGPDGRFTLDGIGASSSSVRVQAEGYHSRILGGVAFGAGETQQVEVELTPVADGEEPSTELAGIGCVLMPRREALIIRRIVEGGGAARAGLQPGDLVLAVDGTPVTTLGFGGTIDHIRGVEGTTVLLTVQRQGAQEPTDIAITRERVRT